MTKKAAFFTDSQRPVLYRVALSKHGAPGALTTIPLTGEYQQPIRSDLYECKT